MNALTVSMVRGEGELRVGGGGRITSIYGKRGRGIRGEGLHALPVSTVRGGGGNEDGRGWTHYQYVW